MTSSFRVHVPENDENKFTSVVSALGTIYKNRIQYSDIPFGVTGATGPAGGTTLTSGNNILISSDNTSELLSVNNSIVISNNHVASVDHKNDELFIGSLTSPLQTINIGPFKYFMSNVKTGIMNQTDTTLFYIPIPTSLQSVGCNVIITIKVTNGIDVQLCQSNLNFMGINKNGNLTATVVSSASYDVLSMSDSKLSVLFLASVSGINAFLKFKTRSNLIGILDISARCVVTNSGVDDLNIFE